MMQFQISKSNYNILENKSKSQFYDAMDKGKVIFCNLWISVSYTELKRKLQMIFFKNLFSQIA